MNLTRALMTLAGTMVLASCAGAGSDKTQSVAVNAPRDTAMIDSIPACTTCSIVVADSVLLGSIHDKNIPQRMPHFVRDERGQHYLVFIGWSNQPVLRYDSTGRYAGRVGASGQGPGEYRMPGPTMIADGDSLVLFEMFAPFGQVYSPEGKYVRRIRDVRGQPIHITTATRTHLYSTRESRGFKDTPPVYVIRSGEHRVDSFAIFSPVLSSKNRVQPYRIIDGIKVPVEVRLPASATVAPDGSVWAYSSVNYRLEQHDTTGAPRKLFGVRVAGEPPPRMTSAALDSALDDKKLFAALGVPRVRSAKTGRSLSLKRWLDVDSAGLLWVTRQIPAPSWDTITVKPLFLAPGEAPTEETIPRDVEDRLYHTVVEVIDPRPGQMLARITLPFLGERVRAGFIGRVTANDDGFFIPSVYRLHLRRQ